MKSETLIGIVTYNRKKLLERCIKNIKKQTYKNYDLLVVNNGSTDNTGDYLKKLNINHINNPPSGSAFGWYSLIKYAKTKNYNFLWLMDDDGYPKNDALEILIDNIDTKKHVCLSSVVVKENNNQSLVFPIPQINYNKFPKLGSFHKNFKNLNQFNNFSSNKMYDFAHLFNGALFNIKKLSKKDNVNLHYHHHGVELDFYYRLLKKGKLTTHFNAIHYHPDTSKRNIDIKWIFYYVKNSIIVNKMYLNYSLIRNLKVIFGCIIRIFLRNGIYYLIFKFLLSRNIFIFFKAIIDGYNLRFTKI